VSDIGHPCLVFLRHCWIYPGDISQLKKFVVQFKQLINKMNQDKSMLTKDLRFMKQDYL